MSPFTIRTSFLLMIAVATAVGGDRAAACGADSDCAVSRGSYRIALPATGDEEEIPGAIVYLHGYRGTPEGVMDFDALRKVAERLGVALLAPRGEDMSWNLPAAFAGGRDDVAFIGNVVEDAIARFDIDANRVLVSGFSVGGSMVWYLACAEGRRYAAYAPIAGAFWEPYVAGCRLPLPRIRHVHGRADRTVPLEGRRLSIAVQGDVFLSFEILRRFSYCTDELTGAETEGDLTCERQSCGGSEQELCLHPGGHSVRPEWIEEAWQQLSAEGQ